MFHAINVLASYTVLAFTLIAARIVYNIFLHPLRQYPGPKLWAASRLAWAHGMQSGDYHQKLQIMHERYGRVVRVAPDELSFTDPEAWKDIYGNRKIRKNSTWTGNEEKDHPISIVSTDEATHLRNRRALTGAFTEHAMAEHALRLEGLVGLMIQRFKEAIDNANGCTVLEVGDWLNWLTFDISGALSFGESFDSIKSGRAHPWVLKLAMPKEIMKKMRHHKQLVHEKFVQRLGIQPRAKAQDYVGSIMAYNKEKGEVKMSKEEIEANMTLLIFAGSETTSSAMAAILTELLRSPAALKKATDEVRSSFALEQDITVASTAKLEYLTAVIQEGIRMGPPAAVGVPRVVPKEGATIMGQPVSSDTFVSVNQYPTFRSATNFTEADLFMPERFLPGTPFPKDLLSAFEPFLLVRHKCIGQKPAWAIMRLTLARMLFSFNIKATSHVADFGKQKTYVFWEKRALNIKMELSRRSD